MLNIFKDIPMFSEDFIQFKCREMILTFLSIVNYNTNALTCELYLYLKRCFDILTNHTYLHLKQCEIPFSSGCFLKVF